MVIKVNKIISARRKNTYIKVLNKTGYLDRATVDRIEVGTQVLPVRNFIIDNTKEIENTPYLKVKIL